MRKKEHWLITTAHLKEGLWFREEADFKVAMNYVAIQAHCGGVAILAFILMSNHVHFVVQGAREEADEFINAFKQRYSMYYCHKYGNKEFLRRNDVDIKNIPQGDEALERAVAYVQMNCVAAGICAHPSQYPWGTGNAFFSAARLGGRYMGTLSMRARIRLAHSNKVTLPECWRISDEGYILPQSYVDISSVERTFHSANRMNYFLQSSSKAKKRLETAEEGLPALRDQSILAVLPDLCRSLFGKSRYADLMPEQQSELVRQIRYRFSANVNQVARVCEISYADAAKMMDSL